LHSKGIVARKAGIPAGIVFTGAGGRHRVERIYGKELFFVLLSISFSTTGKLWLWRIRHVLLGRSNLGTRNIVMHLK